MLLKWLTAVSVSDAPNIASDQTGHFSVTKFVLPSWWLDC
jgi:hypothetical protein